MNYIKNTVNFYFFVFIVFIISGCSTIEKDCLCTAEYRFYLVTIVDTLGVPVDSLDIIVKDKDGDELDILQENNIFGAGRYTVLTDSFTKMFCPCGTPEKIYFTAAKRNRIASAEYFFNTDDCQCHINKVSGPDTLVIN